LDKVNKGGLRVRSDTDCGSKRQFSRRVYTAHLVRIPYECTGRRSKRPIAIGVGRSKLTRSEGKDDFAGATFAFFEMAGRRDSLSGRKRLVHDGAVFPFGGQLDDLVEILS
jgi:hypothetical protein